MNTEITTVICPKHGEHDHAILSTIPGHEGVWCQICWTESMGPSLPYRKKTLNPINPINPEPGDLNPINEDFKAMDDTIPSPGEDWKTLPKE